MDKYTIQLSPDDSISFIQREDGAVSMNINNSWSVLIPQKMRNEFSKAVSLCVAASDNTQIMENKLEYYRHLYHHIIIAVKLPLRKLSDMTEEENSHCNSLVSGYNTNENPNPIYWTPDQFKYLLLKGFDLFGLIESGLAIDKTKL